MSQADLTMQGHSTGMMADRPFAIPTKKLAMWLFIIADTMTFAACLVAYGFLRNATPDWPRPFHSITNVAVMTFILLTSSLTMYLGVQTAKAGDKASAFRLDHDHGRGRHLIRRFTHSGMDGFDRRRHEPVQESLGHGAVRRGVFQCHRFAYHARYRRRDRAAGGGLRYKGGRYNEDDIEIVGLYWHFVDLVWMFVVPFIYLMNLAR